MATASDFRVVNVSVPVHLPPSRLASVESGVREQLNQYLLRYVEDLGGVVMLYRNVQLPRTRLGVIFQNRPQVNFKVKVEFLIFAPVVNSTIVGRVTTVAHDHIFLLVHQCWNVTIPRDAIPDKWQFDRKTSRFVDRTQSSKTIGVDATIRCRVARLENVGGHFRISGSLLGAGVAVLEESPPPLERGASGAAATAGAAGAGSASSGVKRKRAIDTPIISSHDIAGWAANLGNEVAEDNDDDDNDSDNDTESSVKVALVAESKESKSSTTAFDDSVTTTSGVASTPKKAKTQSTSTPSKATPTAAAAAAPSAASSKRSALTAPTTPTTPAATATADKPKSAKDKKKADKKVAKAEKSAERKAKKQAKAAKLATSSGVKAEAVAGDESD